MSEPVLVGADGCPGGWLCVVQRGSEIAAIVVPSIADAIDRFKPTLLMVDIPIGLTDSGPRECDLEARRQLRPRRASSVFPAPVRAVLRAETYAEVNALHRAADNGKGSSAQAFAIVPKIREVDDLLCRTPGLQDVVREVHPEVCFAHWNGGAPMAQSKKTAEGRAEREALIEARWPGHRARLVDQIRGSAWAANIDQYDRIGVQLVCGQHIPDQLIP